MKEGSKLDPRAEIVKTALKIKDAGLVRGTWGNLSVKDKNVIWITPSGMPYDLLTPEDIVPVDLEDGRVLHSSLTPSSELLMHLEIYHNFPEINAVIHTHSVYASVFAVARCEIPCYTEDQAQIIGGSVRVTPYAPTGTEELARYVVRALENRFAALIANHGAVAIGRSLREAYTVAEILEKSAEIAYALKSMLPDEPPSELEEVEIAHLRRVYLESYGKKIAGSDR
ncbi:MAG TPA: class II aldolase [Thermotogae bacterium]|nr:class II aldolase [Thermotogota bacterium]